jgi:16S rRNA (cytidine1402-2'-O)-methyltransferase
MNKLLLIGNHIGNPMDLSQRAIKELSNADMILAERDYVVAELAEELGISITDNIINVLEITDEQNVEIVNLLSSGKSVVLMSDAGLPLIADPGIDTAQFLFKNNIEIDIVPGPSIPATAHSVAAVYPFNSNFIFQEFMQYSTDEIFSGMKLLKSLPHTLVVIDRPDRFKEVVDIALDVLGDRSAVLLMMLTTEHSKIIRGKLSDILEYCSKEDSLTDLNTLVISGNVKNDWKLPD